MKLRSRSRSSVCKCCGEVIPGEAAHRYRCTNCGLDACDACAQKLLQQVIAAAKALFLRKDFEASLCASLQAISFDPYSIRSADHYARVATCHIELGHPQYAVPVAKRCSVVRPDWCQGYLCLGRAQRRLGLPREALHSFNAALQRSPNRSGIWTALASTLLHLGDLDRAAQSMAEH